MLHKFWHTYSVLLSLLFVSCSIQINNEEIVGVWQADDGGIFGFYGNNQFVASNIDVNNVFPVKKIKNKKLNVKGSWSIKMLNNEKVIELEFISDSFSGGYVNYLYAAGGGILENSLPVRSLYFGVGDPDSGIRYSFSRKR